MRAKRLLLSGICTGKRKMIRSRTKPKLTHWRIFILRAVVTVLLLGLLAAMVGSQGWNEFAGALRRLPPLSFALAVIIILASRVCVTLRWLVLLRFAKEKMTFWQAFRLMFMGNFASNFLPSTVGGDVVRLAGASSLGVEAGVAAASLVLDRLIGMAGMASLSPFGLWIISRPAVAAGLKAPYVLMGAPIWLRKAPGVEWASRKLSKFFHSLVSSSVNWFRQPASLLLSLLFNYGHMLFIFLMIWVLLDGLNQSLSLLWIGALWSLSYFVTLVPISLNGLGLQEVSITMLYSRFGGVSMEAALALAVFVRLLFLLASLPGVLFLPDILRRPAAAKPGSVSLEFLQVSTKK